MESLESFGLTTGNYVVLICVVLPTLIYFFKSFRNNDNFWKDRGIVYEPQAAWYTTIRAILTKNLSGMQLEKYKRHGRLYGEFERRTPILVIAEPDLLRDVLVKDFHSFTDRRQFNLGHPLISKMVFALNGEKWKRVRSIITPAFTSGKMRKMANIINDCSKAVIDSFTSSAENSIPADCKKVFGTFAMDVIASSAFATKIDSHNDPNNIFAVHARKAFSHNSSSIFPLILSVISPQFILKLLKKSFFDQDSVEFFRNVTLQVIEERRSKSVRGNDFLQLMMDANAEQHEADKKMDGFKTLDLEEDEKDNYGHGDENHHIFKTVYQNKKMTHDELLAQCILFFMVGYETTGSTLTFAAYNIATNPDCQEKLIREIDQVIKEKGELTYDSIKEMKYLDCVISETLRIHPAVLRAERTAVEDYKLGDTGITVSKGMTILFPIYAIHHDPEFFSEPEKFIPERFLPENISHPSYAYLPFGAGPRNCLGMRFALMEIKLCLANILRVLKFKICPETKIPLEFGNSIGFLTPQNVMLAIEKRNDK